MILMCQDGQNATVFWNVPRWAKCNSVLECVKMGKIQKCFGMCQEKPNATMCQNGQNASVLECAKTGQMQQCFGVCQDGQNAKNVFNVPRWAKCNNVPCRLRFIT